MYKILFLQFINKILNIFSLIILILTFFLQKYNLIIIFNLIVRQAVYHTLCPDIDHTFYLYTNYIIILLKTIFFKFNK